MSRLKCSTDQRSGNGRKVFEWRCGLTYWFGRPKGNAPLAATGEALDVRQTIDE